MSGVIESFAREAQRVLARVAPDTDVRRDIDAVAAGGLPAFVRLAWPLVVPGAPLKWNWHLDAVCEHLTALTKREITDLVINQPSGTGKSNVASVLWPVWHWTRDPAHWWMWLSYSDNISLRDAQKVRDLIQSEWFQARWPSVQIRRGGAKTDSAGVFKLTSGGQRLSRTIPGGNAMGEHCDTMGVDDPIDPKRASRLKRTELEAVLRFWRETQPTRYRDQKTAGRLCVMQRLHVDDLAGLMIREGATVLALPMEFEPNHPHRYKKDPRKEPGELLDAERFPRAVVDKLKEALGTLPASGQLQQRPDKPGGTVFHETWFRFWTELPEGGQLWLSVDCAFKDEAGSSFVVLQVWATALGNFYLVDQVRRQMDFPATLAAIRALVDKYPKIYRKLIEDKANGPAVIATLKRQGLTGIEAINPDGGKEARANAVAPTAEAGRVFLPDPIFAKYPDGRRGAPWVRAEFLPEVVSFPRASTDDQVDAMTQMLNRAAPGLVERLRRAMAAV